MADITKMYGIDVKITQLHYVRAVAQLGSFSRAARSFGVSQPGLSNGIAQLERVLGGRLFERTTRGAVPTRLGHAVIPLVERALSSVEVMVTEARAAAGRTGRVLRMGVSPLIHPALVARAFEASRTGRRGGLVLQENNLANLEEALNRRELDLVLVPAVTDAPGCRRRQVDTEAMYCLFGEDAARGASTSTVEVTDLEGVTLVTVVDACGLTRFVKDLLTANGVEVTRYPGDAHSYRNLVEWADLGLGVALLPESKLGARRDQAVPLVSGGREVRIGYEALWPANSPHDAEVEQLLDAMLDPATTPT